MIRGLLAFGVCVVFACSADKGVRCVFSFSSSFFFKDPFMSSSQTHHSHVKDGKQYESVIVGAMNVLLLVTCVAHEQMLTASCSPHTHTLATIHLRINILLFVFYKRIF